VLPGRPPDRARPGAGSGLRTWGRRPAAVRGGRAGRRLIAWPVTTAGYRYLSA